MARCQVPLPSHAPGTRALNPAALRSTHAHSTPSTCHVDVQGDVRGTDDPQGSHLAHKMVHCCNSCCMVDICPDVCEKTCCYRTLCCADNPHVNRPERCCCGFCPAKVCPCCPECDGCRRRCVCSCCEANCICDPCALCYGPYKGDVRLLQEDIRKNKGAPAGELAMQR